MFEGMFGAGPSFATGLAQLNPNDFDMIRKAVTTGYDIGGTSQTGAGAMRVENLDSTLAVLTEQMHEFVILNDLQKQRAAATAIEYAQNTALAAQNGGFYQEGELPETRDASYTRQAAFMKYAGTVVDVSMPAQLAQHLVDQSQEAIRGGTVWVQRLLEKTLFKGNSKLGLAGAEGVEFDGLESYVATAHAATGVHVKTLWGRALEEFDIRDASTTIINYHGFSNRAYLPSEVYEDLSASYLRHYQIRPADGGSLKTGFSVDALQTTGRDPLQFKKIYLYKGLTRETSVSSAASRAPSPAITCTAAVQATGTGQWENSLNLTVAAATGTATYGVAVANGYGEAVPVAATGGAVTVNYANRVNSIRVTITNPAGGYVSAPTYAAIYRNDTAYNGAATGSFCVARVAMTAVTAGASGLVWDDDGDRMPGTYSAWILELNPMIINIRELLPFSRISMPMLALSNRTALVNFLTTCCRNPYRIVEIRNIGRRSV